MVLFCIVGELGSGKTLSLTWMAWKNWLFRKQKIFSNYHLYKIPHIYITDINQLQNAYEGFVALDEIWRICIDPETNIIAHNGNSEKITEVEKINPVLSLDFDSFKLENSPVLYAIKNYASETVELKTKHYSIKCSKYHPFFVFNGKAIEEKQAKDLNKNDWVLTVKKIDEPKKELIDWKLSQLIGYIFADGHIFYRCGDWRRSKYAIQLNEGDKKCIEKYQNLLSSLNVKSKIYDFPSTNCYKLYVMNKKFIEQIIEKIGDALVKNEWGYCFKDIPAAVINSSNRVLGAFLRGVFDGDGAMDFHKENLKKTCFNQNFTIQTRIFLDQTCEDENKIKIVEKIKYLLLRFGIKSVIKKKKNGSFSLIRLIIRDRKSVLNFAKYIGFSHPYKKTMLKLALKFIHGKKRDITFDTLPFSNLLKEGVEKLCKRVGISLSKLEHLFYDKHKIGYFRKSFEYNISENLLSKIINILEKEFEIKEDELMFIKNFLNSNVTLERIVSKKIKKESKFLYDLTIPYYSNYIANGFVVHNCDARMTRARVNQFTGDILGRSRKRHLNISFTSQMIDQIDKRVRKVTDFSAYPILNTSQTVCKLNIFRTGYPKEGNYLKTVYYKTNVVKQCYDTDQEIDMSDDENCPDPEIIFQESMDSEPEVFDRWEEADKRGEEFWRKNKELIKQIL